MYWHTRYWFETEDNSVSECMWRTSSLLFYESLESHPFHVPFGITKIGFYTVKIGKNDSGMTARDIRQRRKVSQRKSEIFSITKGKSFIIMLLLLFLQTYETFSCVILLLNFQNESCLITQKVKWHFVDVKSQILWIFMIFQIGVNYQNMMYDIQNWQFDCWTEYCIEMFWRLSWFKFLSFHKWWMTRSHACDWNELWSNLMLYDVRSYPDSICWSEVSDVFGEGYSKQIKMSKEFGPCLSQSLSVLTDFIAAPTQIMKGIWSTWSYLQFGHLERKGR